MMDHAAIVRAHGAIYATWSRFIGAAEAREQADGFVRRFFLPANDNAAVMAEYEALLARIAEVVADTSPRAAMKLVDGAIAR